jgi:hypothetical protein
MRPNRWVLALALAGVSIVVSACGETQQAAPSDDAFWAGLRVVGDETEYFAELGDMGEGADIVATGNFTDFQLSRTIRDAAVPEDVVSYAVASFETTEMQADTAATEVLPVEFLLPGDTEAEQLAAVERLRAELPQAELVVFLRAKSGPEEDGLYRLVNSTGLWVDEGGGIKAPLVHEGETPYEDAVADVGSVAELFDVATNP